MSKRTVRMVMWCLIGLAPLVGIYIWVRSKPQGRAWLDVPPVRTVGYVAALQELENGGTRVVSIAPDGTIRMPKGGPESTDEEFTWAAGGRRIIFSSNRSTDGSEQLFSWAPDRDAEAVQETPAGTVRLSPWFYEGGSETLFCARGDVLALTWPEGKVRPIMPPAGKRVSIGGEDMPTVEEQGGASQENEWISSGWGSLADSLQSEGFETSRLFGGGNYFAGICRTAEGPVLILANMKPADQAHAMPRAQEGGEQLEISTLEDKPLVVVSVRNFRYPIASQVPESHRKADGSFVKDYVNALLVIDMEKGTKVAPFLLNDLKLALMQPALSPKGDEVAVCVNVFEKDVWKPKALILVPIETGAFNQGRVSTLAEGEVYDPSWSSDGSELTYIKGGDVYTIRRDGSGEKNWTNGKGKFRRPRFSPQK